MSQENYTIIPLMGVDQSGNTAIAPTPLTFNIGLPNNPIATITNGSPLVNLTVPTPSNFTVGQTITVSGVNATVGNITAANLNVTSNITAINATSITYTAAANANGAHTGGGANVVLTFNASNTDYKPLERLACSDGTTRMFVRGTVATINAGDCVLVDGNGNAQQISTALATQLSIAAGYTVGFALTAITYSATTPNYGWVVVNGPCQVNVVGATTVGTALFTSTTLGQLALSGNGGADPYLVLGIMAITASVGNGTVNAISTYPMLGQTAGGSL